jgi:outer membrane protein assembly factor BamB
MRTFSAGLIALCLVATGCGLPLTGKASEGRAPDWRTRVRVRPADVGEALAAATADTVVVRIGRSVAGLDRRTGRQRWTYQGRDGDVGDAYVDVAVTGDVVAVSGRKTGEGTWLDVLDAASGRRLWSHRARTGELTVVADAVYTADCPRDCVVSRHDPRTGRVGWTLHEPRGTRIEPPDLGARIGRTEPRALEAQPAGPYVLLRRGDGRGPRDRVTALDARTGRRLAGAPYPGWIALVTPQVIVVGRPLDERDEDPACRYALRAWDVDTGRPAWHGEVSTHASKRLDRPGCSGLLSDDVYALGLPPATLVATTADGRPQAVDLTTGTRRWAAQRPGVPIDAGGTAVLVRDARSRGPIRGLDPATGRQRWQVPDPNTPAGDASTAVLGDSVLVGSWGSTKDGRPFRVAVLDASDGHRRWVTRPSGGLVGAGAGWFAVSPAHAGTDDGGQEIAFYDLSS